MQQKFCMDPPRHFNNSWSMHQYVVLTGRQEYYSFGMISISPRFKFVLVPQAGWWRWYNLLEIFPLLLWWSVLVFLAGGRIYLWICPLDPAKYRSALIWHTYLYSMFLYGFLIKNKFPGIFFVALGVGTMDWSWVFSHFFFACGRLL